MTVAALASVVLPLAAMLLCAATALAPDTVIRRSTIGRIDSTTYEVTASDGARVMLAPAGDRQTAGVVKPSLSDIKQASFVGVTAMTRANGSQSALEVHIFPKAM